MTIRTVILGVLLAGSQAAGATGDATLSAVDAPAAFARLKTLVGEWDATTGNGKVRVSYELVAGGSALLERETGEKLPTMLTMYHLDGGRLLLTHYCMAGNQPRMQARTFDQARGELRFSFLDATNLPDPSAGHMHEVTIRFVDATRMTTAWQFYEKGRPSFVEAAEYTKVR